MSNKLEAINKDFEEKFHEVFQKPELIQSFLTNRSKEFDLIIIKAFKNSILIKQIASFFIKFQSYLSKKVLIHSFWDNYTLLHKASRVNAHMITHLGTS